jgi:hypothetical protein
MKRFAAFVVALFLSSAAFAAASKSVGSVTVASVVTLAGVQATNTITVGSTSTLKNVDVTINGKRLRNGYEWKTGATTAATATNIAASLDKIVGIEAEAIDSVVYATATATGTGGNAYTLSASGSGLTVGTALFAGGVNAGYITINGVRLTVGVDCASAAAMAKSLSDAIMANTTLTKIIISTHTGSVVYATSTQVGTNAYSLVGYPANKLVASGAAFTSGGNPDGEITRFQTVIANHFYGDGTGLSGSTSDIGTELALKAPAASPTFTGTITTPLVGSKVLVSAGTGALTESSVSTTTLSYMDATSAVQGQINAKAPAASPTFTGTVRLPHAAAIRGTIVPTSAFEIVGNDNVPGQVCISTAANSSAWVLQLSTTTACPN